MTAKEYLAQARGALIDCRIQKERIEQSRSLAISTAPATSGGGSSGSISDKVGKNAAKTADLEAEYEDKYRYYLSLRRTVEQQIDSLDDDRHRRLLSLYYLLGHKLEECADIMHYSVTHIVHNLHPEALAAFDKKYNNYLTKVH